MKKYHITYYIDNDRKKLSGLTIESDGMISALKMFLFEMDYKIKEKQVKYIIEL